MRRALVVAVVVLVAGCGGGVARSAAPPLRLLFLGNSLTATNDLPAVVASLSHGTVAYRAIDVHNYRRAAAGAHARLLPAGEAWQAAWRRNPRLALYGPDGFHPSRLGTTLAALVIYAKLTGTPPVRVTLPYPAKTARLLRAAASEVISR